jgi:hypothetical protein
MISRSRIENLRIARRVRWVTLGAALTLWLGACSGDSATGPKVPATPEGNYSLTSVDARAVPYMMYSDTGFTLEVTAGSIAINSNGKWVAKVTSRETIAGYASMYVDSTFGTWTSASGAATLINTETQATASATWTATEVTINQVEGTTTRKVIYRRN